MTDFENSLLIALHASATAQENLARQIQHQTLAIQALADGLSYDGDDDVDDVYVADVMNPRNG